MDLKGGGESTLSVRERAIENLYLSVFVSACPFASMYNSLPCFDKVYGLSELRKVLLLSCNSMS